VDAFMVGERFFEVDGEYIDPFMQSLEFYGIVE
jgi:hypothetical protein